MQFVVVSVVRGVMSFDKVFIGSMFWWRKVDEVNHALEINTHAH